MPHRAKGTPEQYAGAFQAYEDIPQRYRLETFEGHYRNDETWERFVEEVLLEDHDSKRRRKTADLAGASWLEHMGRRDRHHALAQPRDVESWCQSLLEDKVPKTCYEYYFIRVHDFYDHLRCSHRHPHLYNPVLIAAIQNDAARKIWMVRVNHRERVAERREESGRYDE